MIARNRATVRARRREKSRAHAETSHIENLRTERAAEHEQFVMASGDRTSLLEGIEANLAGMVRLLGRGRRFSDLHMHAEAAIGGFEHLLEVGGLSDLQSRACSDFIEILRRENLSAEDVLGVWRKTCLLKLDNS